MLLFVMRHGPAEDGSGFMKDFERRLTPEGRAVTRRVAEELARRGEPPPRILTSPVVRAVETANIVRDVLGSAAPLEERGELAPSEDARSLVLELARDTASALVVSHAPDVSLLTDSLLSRGAGAFSPARIVAVAFDGGRGTLRFTIEPR